MYGKVIQARVSDEVYAQASAAIQAAGLSISDVVRSLMTRIANEKSVPLDMFQPNAETLQALEEVRQGRTEPTTIEAIVALIAEERESNGCTSADY